ncbi:MAG: RodZ domain-containing protein [Bacteroidota bacterium]
MNWFAEELQKQRVTKGISLNEIALMTRINIHFLEALEQGNFEALPQTYTRAFIREYAISIGLNPVEALQRFDLFLGKRLEPAPEPVRPGRQREPIVSQQWTRSTKILISAIIIVLLGFIGIYIFVHSSDSQSVRQIAFDDVVKETERISTPQQVLHKPVETAASRVTQDSLRLLSSTSDTVWLSIIIDGKRTEEYLFPPKAKYAWTAKEKFSVTLGNAGGIRFTLNGIPLEPLGRNRAVVRNVVISKESIQRQNSERR